MFPSLAHIKQTSHPWTAIGRLVSLAYITRDLTHSRVWESQFGIRNLEFFRFLFVIIWVYQNFWVCYICLGFFTHIARGEMVARKAGKLRIVCDLVFLMTGKSVCRMRATVGRASRELFFRPGSL